MQNLLDEIDEYFGELLHDTLHSVNDSEVVWLRGKKKLILYFFHNTDINDNANGGRCALVLLESSRKASLFDNVSVMQFEVAIAWLNEKNMGEIEENATKLYDLFVDLPNVDFDPAQPGTDETILVVRKRHAVEGD